MKTTSTRTSEVSAGSPEGAEKLGARFPTTQWGLLNAARAGGNTTRIDVLNEIMKGYWRPLYAYVRSKGHQEHEAEDMVQSFLVACLERDLFARAKKEKGRFRTYLRKSCDHFMQNSWRAAQAKKRRPRAGLVSLDELAAEGGERRLFEPRTNETPENVFNRVWACDLLERMLKLFKEDCERSGKQVHHKIFEVRIIKPALEGSKPPSLLDLATQHKIDEKKAANYLLTARRTFQRLLREEVSAYALSDEDVTAEINDLFELLAPSHD